LNYELLMSCYLTIKNCDADLKPVLMTGLEG